VDFRGNLESNLGGMLENTSKGAQNSVEIIKDKLALGVNSVCIYNSAAITQSSGVVYGTGAGGRANTSGLTDEELDSNFASWCTNITYSAPAPTVTPECTAGVPTARIDWNNSNPPAEYYNVDIDDDDDFSNGFWRWFGSPPTTSIPDAPNGFTGWAGKPAGGFTFTPGASYRTRVFYKINGIWTASQIRTFTARSDCVAAPPPPPTVTQGCDGTTPIATISWTPQGAGVSGHYIDIDNDNNWDNGYWNRGESAGTTSINDAPALFNKLDGSGETLNFTPGLMYRVRIYYEGPNVLSDTASLTVDTSCTAPVSGPTCVGFSTSPSIPEPGQDFTAVAKFQTNENAGGVEYKNATHPLKLTIDTLTTDQPVPYSSDPLGPQPLDDIGKTNELFSGGIPLRGKYDVTFTVISNPGVTPVKSLTCTSTVPSTSPNYVPPVKIESKPYFRVYGGDVLAGAGNFYSGAPTCSRQADATIAGWNQGSPTYAGAGVQLAAQALGVIDEFASAVGQASGPPNTLSFANSGVLGSYGGTFGASPCSPDDAYDTTRLGGATSVSGSFDVGSAASGDYSSTSSLTIIGGTLAPGTRQTVYVEGDVTITGSITYNPVFWSNPSEVPSFTVVAKGDIFILPAATQLDGTYVAQPGTTVGSGGTIYTCAPGGTAPTLPGSLPGCETQLVVNGAFIAHNVRLLRTVGTLRTNNGGNQELSSSTNIAEVFNFSPELYIRPPLNPGSSSSDYDAITSLPPVL